MPIPNQLLEAVATGAAGMVAGAMAYITVIDAPARGKLSSQDQLKHWQTAFPPAGAFFKPAGLLLVPILSATAYVTEKPAYYGGAVAFGTLAPFTVIAIAPTNKRLLSMKEPADQQEEQEVVDLVKRWAQRHAVRVVCVTAGFGLCLYGYGTSSKS